MEPTTFDNLTKALATSTSRRAALKALAATTLGGLLGLGGLGTAFGKNKTCAQFCSAVFGDTTPAAEQCTTDAAHHTGLCYSCGSNTPASSICCTRNSSGFCSSYSPTLPCACPSGQVCQNGTCVPVCPPLPACNDTCPCDASQCQTCQGGTCVSRCGSGQVCLSNGTCASPCTPGVRCSCGFCFSDASGADYCSPSALGTNSCTNDSQCNKGYFCYFVRGFGGSCIQAC